MFRRLRHLILLSAFLSAFAAHGRTVSGTVRNEEGILLPAVMVKATLSSDKVCHTTTDRNGSFSIGVGEGDSIVVLRFSRLGYDTENIEVRKPFGPLSVTMHRGTVALKEVTVRAAEVKVKGDTISYRMDAIAGKGDVTLQDALKKVPGVDVKGDGEIKYNGRSISHFYINSMDLLGGRYNIATTSIPHSYVSTVEVLNNHEDIRMERKTFNDNVALNVRLKPKAMFKPMGKYEGCVGYGDKALGEFSGAGMIFSDRHQAILTLKGGNIKEFAAYDNKLHYRNDRSSGKNYADDILGKLSSFSPPLARERWISPLDAEASVNYISKLSEDATVRVNAGYEYEHTKYDYSESAAYFGGDADVVIDRSMTPSEYAHKPYLSLEYRLNSDKRYIDNSFRGDAAFNSADLPTAGTASAMFQGRTLKSFSLSDNLVVGLSHGKTKWYYESTFSFCASPAGKTEAVRDEPNAADMLQRVRTYSFSTTQSFSGRIERQRWSLYLPVDMEFSYDRIHTALENRGFGDEEYISARNNLSGSEFKATFSPRYEYAMPYNRLVVRVGLPIGFNLHRWKNRGDTPYSDSRPRFGFSPSVYINYEASAKSTFRGTVKYNDDYGGILDLLTAPVMTDYISMQLKSGIIAHRRSLASTMHYGLKSPLSMWSGRINIGFTKGWNNLLSRQYVSSGLIAVSNFLSPNSYDIFNADAGVSKRFSRSRTVISLSGSWTWSRRRIEQNGMLVKYYGSNFSVTPKINTNPCGWLELSYNLDMSFSSSRFLNSRSSYNSRTHDIGVKLFPADKWEFSLNSDIIRDKIPGAGYKTVSLFDAGAVYKHKTWRFGMKMRNILNNKSFSYSVFNGLDRFSYSYALRGRELLFSITFIK